MKQHQNNIAVNATALRTGGGLTILNQFLHHASNDSDHHYICFVPKGIEFEKSKNITLVEIHRMNALQRILWDSIGFKRAVYKRSPYIKKAIGLQNTTMNIDAPQLIYLHQCLPFLDIKWSFFKKEERAYFLYKHFYKFFIFLYAKHHTQYVVQTNWVKKTLINLGIKPERIDVIKPDMMMPIPLEKTAMKPDGIHKMLYPAPAVPHKNHKVVLQALQLLKGKNIQFQVTFKKGKYPKFDKIVKKLSVDDLVEYTGEIAYKDIFKNYLEASMVLFPSYGETFGLPLIEAAQYGKRILCADLGYSREVLSNYEGAIFLNHTDAKQWASAIETTIDKIAHTPENQPAFVLKQYTTSWADFFNLL